MTIRTAAIHALVVCDPARCLERLRDATPAEIAYARSLLASLGKRADRYITPAMRQEGLAAARKAAVA